MQAEAPDTFELVLEDDDDYYMEDEPLCLPDPGSDLPSPTPIEQNSPEITQTIDFTKYIYQPSSSQEPSKNQTNTESITITSKFLQFQET